MDKTNELVGLPGVNMELKSDLDQLWVNHHNETITMKPS